MKYVTKTPTHDTIYFSDIMEHDSDKNFFEWLIKNILQRYNLIANNLEKSECPDFKNDNLGLEITRADQSLEFSGFISKYSKDNNINIKKFNKNFEKLGGKVFKRNDSIVKILNLSASSHIHKDYIYIIPSYSENFDFVNERINDKLKKLNSTYDKNIKHYYLGIFTPIYALEDNIKEEFNKIIELQSNHDRKFEKIIIIFVDKICEFDLLDNTYNIIENTEEELNNISTKTYEKLNNK